MKASRFYSFWWRVGDFARCLSFLILLIGPLVGMGATVPATGSETLAATLQRAGLVLLFTLGAAATCFVFGSVLMLLVKKGGRLP
jgi:hypothetical protein